MTKLRIDCLIQVLKEAQIPLLALNPGASLTYLTGLEFHRMERPIILWIGVNGKIALTLPALESAKLLSVPFSIQPFLYSDDPSTWQSAFQETAKYLNCGKCALGIEPNSLRILEYRFLEAAFPESSFRDAGQALSELRAIKEDVEISAMRKAVSIAQEALLAVLPDIKPGITEEMIAAKLTIQLIEAGSHPQLPFYPIVAGGLNSANPHATPTARPLQNGDLVVIDWGASYSGYCSDLTRTFALGEIDPEFETIFHLVEEANRAALFSVNPGIPASAVDQAARTVIQQGGYGHFFTHRTGHGLGMEEHEPPYIHAENKQILSPGMAFTIEPGIYLPQKGGVRIEDNILVTPEGRECLSDLPRHLTKLV